MSTQSRHGTIKHRVSALLEEAHANGMDLTRYGLAQATAYRFARGEMATGIDFSVLAVLCAFFSERLGRPIGVGDILVYEPGEKE